MKNITKQYQDLLEGKMSKDNFMRSVRRDFPQWIAPVNSFQDAVNILKSKRILTEADAGRRSGPSDILNPQEAAKVVARLHGNELTQLSGKERQRRAINLAGAEIDKNHPKQVGTNLAGLDQDWRMDFISTLNQLLKAAEDESTFSQMQANRGFDPNNPGQGSTLEGITEVSDDTVEQDLKNLRAMGYTYEEAITAIAAILDMDYDELADEYPQDRIDTEGHEYQQDSEDYDDMRAADARINRLQEAAEKPEGRYKEATGKAEYDKFAEMDRVNYRQLMKGMEYELLKMPEITDENLIKAKKKAYSNLIKNPKAYLDLLVRNEKEVEKRDKDLRMQAVKKDNLADKANAMKVLKKDEGSNTQTNQSNKEKAKGMPQGVKVMKESFVEQLRNYILSEMIEVGSPKTSFRIGEMVKTPEGEVGTVEEVTPDNTAKIKLESGTMVEYQGNVLEAHEADHMMQEDEPDMRSSDYDDSSFQAFSKEKDAAVSNETATNKYGDTFEVGKTAITHDNKELKITGFTKEQGKIKARYNAGTSAGLYDIDGLSKKEDKHTDLKEKLVNAVKETMYKNPKSNKTLVANDSAAEAAIKRTVPGAQKIAGSENVTGT